MNTMLLFFLFYTNNTFEIDSCKEKYTDFILREGLSPHSYYLNVCIKDNTGEELNVVVTSYELYPILKQEQHLNEEEYIESVKRSILKNQPISLQKTIDGYGKYTFLIYKKDEKVHKIAKQGSDYFIKYFLGSKHPNEFSKKEEISLAAIIRQLIIWNIPVKLGDDDGGFYADTASFKCNTQ